jgi:mannose-1-phosphate guanylyltransferase
MVPICGKPLLAYWIDLLTRHGVDRILINTHYLPETVRALARSHPARNRITLSHEAELLGTAGTLRALPPEMRRDTLFVAHADNLADFDLTSFRARHQARTRAVVLTMLTFDSDTPQSCGIVEEDGRGIVTGFHEKVSNPPGHRANGAIYLCDPAVLALIATLPAGPADISRDVLPRLAGRMQTWFDPGTYLRDIGNPESLRLAQEEWARRVEASHPA